jgi:hypothetical protein
MAMRGAVYVGILGEIKNAHKIWAENHEFKRDSERINY